jgi:LysM repeat protein
MSNDSDQEKSDLENGLMWWVRYAGIPIAVALIAAIAVIAVAVLARIIPEAQTATPFQTAAPTIGQEPPPIINVVVTVINPSPGSSATSTPTATFSSTATSTASSTATPPPTLVPIGQHVVQSGDTLYCLGRAYGIQPNAIAQANDLVSPFTLHAGQVLKIPAAPWAVVPPGPTCKPQFTSPFTTATSTATTPATATLTATAIATATSTPPTPTYVVKPAG